MSESSVQQEVLVEEKQTAVLQPSVCQPDAEKEMGKEAGLSVQPRDEKEDQRRGEGVASENGVIEGELVDSLDQHADGQLAAGDVIGLDAWPKVVEALVDRAKAGNVEAARELRQAVIEPVRQHRTRKQRPVLPAIVIQALGWLPESVRPALSAAQPADKKASE